MKFGQLMSYYKRKIFIKKFFKNLDQEKKLKFDYLKNGKSFRGEMKIIFPYFTSALH